MEANIFLRKYIQQSVTYFILTYQNGCLLTESAGYKTPAEFVKGTLQQLGWEGLSNIHNLEVTWDAPFYLKQILIDGKIEFRNGGEPNAFRYDIVSNENREKIKKGYLEKGIALTDVTLS